MQVPYDEIDPGIRRVVRWLNDHGFSTNDSGDGRTKLTGDGKPLPERDSSDQGYNCVLPFPHVVMSVPVDQLGSECDRLRDLLIEQDIPVGIQGVDESITIQGTYDPCLLEYPAYILLMWLDDSRLP